MLWFAATVSNPPESASAGSPCDRSRPTASSTPSRSWMVYAYSRRVSRRSGVRGPLRAARFASTSARFSDPRAVSTTAASGRRTPRGGISPFSTRS